MTLALLQLSTLLKSRLLRFTVRRALEHQANEVRYVRGLGLGLGMWNSP
jgi:hypothetical protein